MPGLVALDTPRLALMLLAVEPRLRGVAFAGAAGSGKSALLHGLHALLPDAPFEQLPIGADDEALLGELALQAASVIQNTWLYEQLRLKAHLFETLAGVAQTVSSPVTLDDALQSITREACRLMEARMVSLMLLDDTREWLDLRASFGAGPAYLTKPRLGVADSLLGSVVRRRKPLQLENVQICNRYQQVEVARREGLVSLLSVPLASGADPIGTLNVYTGTPHSFSNEEVRILSAFAHIESKEPFRTAAGLFHVEHCP